MVSLSRLLTPFNLSIFEVLIDKRFSVRDLARRNNCSPAKITQFVKLFGRNKMVEVKKEGNRKIVGLNRNNPLARELVSLIFVNKILGSKSFYRLEKNSDSIGVYGSVVEGTVDEHSDIDLWVLAGKKSSFSDSAEIRTNFSKELGREVSLKFFTKKSIERLKKNDKIFYNELECKSKILWGNGFA